MADINQKITLQFETDLEQAKEDVAKLGELYEQSTKPTAAQGALSAEQKSALETEIDQRASDIGLDPAQLKQTLEDINVLKEQARSIDQQNAEINKENGILAEKVKQAKEDEIAALSRAASLLKLPADASREEIELAREKIRNSKDLNMSEKERKELNTAINKEFAKARGAILRQNNALSEQQKNVEQINQNTNKQGTIVDNIRKKYLTLTKNVEERDIVEGKVTKEIVKQRLEIGKNTKAVQQIQEATKRNEKAQKEYADAIKNTPDSFGGKVASAFLYFQALSAIKRVARDAVRTITELDKSLTDISVVTTMTRKQTWNLLGTYQTMAKEVGLTTTEVANLSIAFFRQGRSAVDALRLTETAAKFAKIAAIDVNDAANFLTAAINGFNLAASDATMIIDKFAALGAGAAASAQEIAIALSKVAPAAASAGVEIDNLMAFVTKGIETTREAPENIGTAFKTIFARMRELTDIGKTVEDGMDVNRVESSLRSIGVALRDGNGEFRNLDEVLLEVGQRWDSIDRNQQAYLATTLAGTRQQTRLIALFEDFDRTLELIELSQDSAGVAALQHAEYMKGLEAANSRLKTSFQELITAFVNSEFVISFINLLNDVLEILNTGAGRLVLTIGLLSFGFAVLAKKGITATKVFGLFAFNTGALSAAQATAAGTSGILAKGLVLLNGLLAATPIGWIMIAVAGLVALVLAFSKVRKSVNTTNETMARLKVIFDRWADDFKDLVEGIKKGVIQAFDFLIQKAQDFMNNRFVKGVLSIGKFLIDGYLAAVNFITGGISGNVINAVSSGINSLFRMNNIEKAAAAFRVLTNRIKETNGEIFALSSNTQKLTTNIDKFLALDRIAFKTPQELKAWNEAQNVLRDSIESFLNEELEAGRLSQAEFNQQMGILAASSGDALAQFATRINTGYEEALKTLKAQNRELILDFFENNRITWAEAIKDSSFQDLLEFVPQIAQEFARMQIEGFDRLSRSQQDAIMRGVLFDPAAFLDGLEQAGAATQRFYGVTLPALQNGLDLAAEGTAEAFIRGVQSIQGIDWQALTPSEREIIDAIIPNVNVLRDLSAERLASIAEAGGTAYIKAFQDISEDIKELGLEDIFDLETEALQASAEQQANTLTDYLFDQLAVSAAEKAETTTRLLEEIFSGVVAGVYLTDEQQASLANTLINALGSVDLPGIERRVLSFREDLDQIEQILTKPLDKLTDKDLQLLQRYPEVFDQILDGTFDINEFRQEGIALLEEEIDLAEELILIAMRNQQTLLERGLIDEDQFEASMGILQTNLNLLDLKRQILRTERVNVDAIKERYKMELDLLNAQKQAIQDARSMRDLQKESADIARKSIEATRVGALTTIEAQFNRQQLNAEIAEANRTLQDNIMLAQLEAQQKILEDSQQKAIEAATRENTIAQRESTAATTAFARGAENLANTFSGAAATIAGSINGQSVPTINTVIPNAVNTFQPSTGRSPSPNNLFNDTLSLVEAY